MDHKERYLVGAFQALQQSTLEDLLSGLTIQRIAGRTHLSAQHFNDHCGPKAEFEAEMLRRSGTRSSDDGLPVHEEIQRLYRRLANRDPGVVDAIRNAAYRNLRGTQDAVASGHKMLMYLAMLAAPNDEKTREILSDAHERRAGQLAGMYDGALVALGRETIDELAHGPRTLFTVIAALADGLVLRSRIDPSFDAARLFADVIVPLIFGLTRPAGEDPLGWPDRFSPTRENSGDGSNGNDVRVLPESEATYAAVIDALGAEERAKGRSTVDIASLHGHAERRHLNPSEHALALRGEVMRLVGDGWTLRRLTTIRTPERLDQEEKNMELIAKTCKRPAVEVRALTVESLPLFAPIVVGRRLAVLGLEDPQEFGAGSGLMLTGRAADLCAAYFEDLWNDERCIRLRTRAGVRQEGLREAREAIV